MSFLGREISGKHSSSLAHQNSQMADSDENLNVTIQSKDRPQSRSRGQSVLSVSNTLIGSTASSSTLGAPCGTGTATPSSDKSSDEKNGLHQNVEALYPEQADTAESSTSLAREILFVFVVYLAQLLSLAGMAQTLAPILILGDSFGVHDPGTLSWFTAAYSLTVGSFILPAGRLGDMYGHRRMLLFGWAWFSVFSVLCGVSVYSGTIMFAICRALQGIGPAMLVPNAMALIGRRYPPGLARNLAFSAFGAGGPTGIVIGAAFSSIFAQLVWWPWAFYVLAVTCVGVIILSLIVIPRDVGAKPTAASGKQRPEFDYLGTFTGICGLILVNFAWNQAPLVGWHTPYIYILLIIGTLFVVAFFYVEVRLTDFPLIPLKGLKTEAAFALACIACGWGSHGIWAYYFYLLEENLRGYSALLTSAHVSPVAIVGVFWAFGSGYLMTKTKPAYVMSLAMFCFMAGAILITTAPVRQTYWINTFLSILVTPGGMNLSFPSATIILSAALPKESQGIAASLVAVFVNYSISLGLGFAGTIESRIGEKGLIEGYRGAWYFAGGISGLGLLIALVFIYKTRNRRSRGQSKRETEISSETERDTKI